MSEKKTEIRHWVVGRDGNRVHLAPIGKLGIQVQMRAVPVAKTLLAALKEELRTAKPYEDLRGILQRALDRMKAAAEEAEAEAG